MEDSAVVGIVSVICSTVLGAVGLYLGYRTRTQPFRQALYEKQISLLLEAASSADSLHTAALQLALDNDQQRQSALRQQLSERAREFAVHSTRLSTLIPMEIWKAYVSFHEAVTQFAKAPKQASALDLVNDAFARLAGPTRKFLGADELSEENVRQFGSHRLIDKAK
jgi:hypothetical protein